MAGDDWGLWADKMYKAGIITRDVPPDKLMLGDDVWSALRDAGLFGTGLPLEYEGNGGGFLEMSQAGRALVEQGLGLGLALTMGLHFLFAGFIILRLGSPEQRQTFLPELASGAGTGCLAISEPEGGAHPGRMKTRAVQTGAGYRLTGEKIYLTNAPLASVFAVMAVTGLDSGRNKITAFLVPRDSPGVSVEEISLDALKPSPHGRLVLNEVEVAGRNVLGPWGDAYSAIIKPFRTAEDAMFMGALAGAMKRITLLAASGENAGLDEDKLDAQMVFGRMLYLAKAGESLAREAAGKLDLGEIGDDLTLLTMAGRELTRGFLGALDELHALTGDGVSSALSRLEKDVRFLNRLAQNVLIKKQMNLGRVFWEKARMV